MSATIQSFLQALPKHLGVTPDFVYNKILDADRDGAVQYQEIYDYIQRSKVQSVKKGQSNLKDWYGVAFLANVKRDLSRDLTNTISLSDIDPRHAESESMERWRNQRRRRPWRSWPSRPSR